MVRQVLYRLGHQPHTSMGPRPLLAANVGDSFPVNALTSYDSLGQLIEAYNATASIKIDLSLVRLRDTLAHGRVLCADDVWVKFSLMKFTRPESGSVTVETRYDLTLDWMDKQIARTSEALHAVEDRYRELGGQ
jgi:hypothetical protein